MDYETTLRQQLDQFNTGNFLDSDGDLNTGNYNFYDWFCTNESLERRGRSLFNKVKKFLKVYPVDLDTHYVFFKNNCPMYGRLYDSFSICNRETGDVVYWVTPQVGYDNTAWNERAQIVKAPDFDTPIKVAATFTELLKA